MNRTEMANTAFRRAVEIRKSAKIGRTDPLNVFDIAMNHLGLRVQFLAGSSFEGMFAKEQKTILVPSERPHGRRAFAAAHEIGHWAFDHGSQIDLTDSFEDYNAKPEEQIVNLFGGYLLMFPASVEVGAAEVGLNFKLPTAQKIYELACWLGVGYTTLINHLQRTLFKISSTDADALRHVELKNIRKIFSPDFPTRHLVVTSSFKPRMPIDIQVGDHVIVPQGAISSNDCLTFVSSNQHGQIFGAVNPGISLLQGSTDWAAAIRVMTREFTGWAKYRHLENDNDEND